MAFCSPRQCTFLSHSSVWCHVVAEPAWAQKSLVQTYPLMPSWHQTHILCLIFLTVFVIHWWGIMKTTFGAWGNEVKTILKKNVWANHLPTWWSSWSRSGIRQTGLYVVPFSVAHVLYGLVLFFVFLEKKLTHFGTHCFEVSWFQRRRTAFGRPCFQPACRLRLSIL